MTENEKNDIADLESPVNFFKVGDIFQCKLRLKDDTEITIPMREDGYIFATKLCQVAGKRLTKWRENQSTKELIIKMEAIPQKRISPLIEIKKGGKNIGRQGTWIHPDLGIHLAQWCSPSFSLQVSKWVRELIITEKVELGQEKNDAEIQQKFLELQEELRIKEEKYIEELKVKEEKITELKTSSSSDQTLIVKLKKSNARLSEKNRFYYSFKELSSVYIISNPDIPVQKFKIGYTDNMNVRLKSDRTMAPNLRVEFLLYTPHAILFEKIIKAKYRNKMEAPNHEWVYEPLDKLIQFYKDQNILGGFDGVVETEIWKYNLEPEPSEEKKESQVVVRKEVKKAKGKPLLDLKSDVLKVRLKNILPYFLNKHDYVLKNEKAPENQRFCNAFCQKYLPVENFAVSEKGVIPLCKNCENLEDIARIKIDSGELTEKQVRENPFILSCGEGEKTCRICHKSLCLDQFEIGKQGQTRRQCKDCRKNIDKGRKDTFDVETVSKKFQTVARENEAQLKDAVEYYPKDRLIQIITALGVGRKSHDVKNNMVKKICEFFLTLKKDGKTVDHIFA